MWGATMFDQLVCRIMFHQLRYEGTFTPPSLQGTLVFPGNLGMFEWGGIAVDPVRQIAIANPIAMPFVSNLIPRGPGNPPAPTARTARAARSACSRSTACRTASCSTRSSRRSACRASGRHGATWPAIDLKTHEIVWMHRNGTIRDSSPIPLPIKMGMPMLGGPITTAGGVAFLTSTGGQLHPRLRRGQRAAALGGPPARRRPVDADELCGRRRQYVVTAAGGHGSFGTSWRLRDCLHAAVLIIS